MAFYRNPPMRKRPMYFAPAGGKRFRPSSTQRVNQLNRRTARGPKTTGTLAQQVKSLQRFAKSLAPETKYIDVSLAQTNLPSTGAVTHITAIGQGDTQSTRTGNTINVTSVAIRAALTGANDVVSVNIYFRFAIVADKEQIADTQPSIADIFTNGIAVSNGIAALPNLDNLERFKILYCSPVRYLKAAGGTLPAATETQSMHMEYNWKGNWKVSFNGANSTDMEKNNVYFCVLVNGSDTLDMVGVARIGYTDV